VNISCCEKANICLHVCLRACKRAGGCVRAFVCVRGWENGSIGVCMRVRASSLAYPACNAYGPYSKFMCVPSGSTTFFDVIS
jgi:hypothetical protein